MNDVADGVGVLSSSNGNIYRGTWKAGLKDGIGTVSGPV